MASDSTPSRAPRPARSQPAPEPSAPIGFRTPPWRSARPRGTRERDEHDRAGGGRGAPFSSGRLHRHRRRPPLSSGTSSAASSNRRLSSDHPGLSAVSISGWSPTSSRGDRTREAAGGVDAVIGTSSPAPKLTPGRSWPPRCRQRPGRDQRDGRRLFRDDATPGAAGPEGLTAGHSDGGTSPPDAMAVCTTAR